MYSRYEAYSLHTCVFYFYIFTVLFSGSSKQYKPWELGRVNEQFLHELSDKDYPPYGIYN